MRQLVIFFALGAVALGCATSADDDAEPIATKRAAIIDGSQSPASQDAVVLVVIKNRGSCTGTLVAPNLVLTARHCVTQTDEGAQCTVSGTSAGGGELYSNFSPSDLLVYKGQQAALMADDPTKASAKGKQIITETTSTYCDHDVAFILLDRIVNAPVAAIRTKEGARQGETITAVGWGLTEKGTLPSERMQRPGIRVEAIGPYVFDQSTQIGLGKSEFLIGEGFCSGDSGGPAIASTGAVVGVVSRGGNGQQSSGADSCIGSDTIGIYTHLALKQTLVSKAFTASGYTLRDEGTPPGKAAGEACAQNVDCSSNTCVSKVCRPPCTDDTVCETDETCTAKSGLMICLPGTKPATTAPEPASGDESAPAAATTTTTTTTSGCSAAPSGTSSAGSPFALLGLAALAGGVVRRRRVPRDHERGD